MDDIGVDNAELEQTSDFYEPEEPQMESDNVSSPRLCDLCHDIGESVNASVICKDEHIYLCDPCGRRHQIQKATKSHKVITIEEDRKNEVLCDLCLCENERIPAYGYCETCEDPDYMCVSCSKRHTASKMFKTHSVNTDLQTRPNNAECSALDARHDKGEIESDMECILCAENGDSNTAICFCTSCKLPEPLCNNCGRHHTRQRDTRGHSLSYDMKAYILHMEENRIKCELCILDNQINFATSFCLSCPEPEALCKNCSFQHTKQRSYKNHKLCDDIGRLPKNEIIWCEPCTIESSKNKANSFCLDCDDPEPLCNNCAREHTKQRQFRNHSICKDISQMRRKEDESVEFCAICKDEGNKIRATCFCRDCDPPEPLCTECARQHTRQKGFRKHELCDNLSILKDGDREKRNIFCASCKIDGKIVLADAYCNDCPDPEPLCNVCAGHHIKQKQFRKHGICTNIASLRMLETPKEKVCDICKLDGKISIATIYCKDCKENLCPVCERPHSKFFRDHVVTDKMSDALTCKACERGNNDSQAKSFCENCNEPMCKICSKQHLQQKPSKDHTICWNIQLFENRPAKENDLKEDTQGLVTQDISVQTEEQMPKPRKISTRSKPAVLSIQSDSVELFWEKLEDEEVDYYQIRFKRQKEKDQWKYSNTGDSTNKFTVGGLMADTSYIFQIRSIAKDIEGDYSEPSDGILTTKSLATKILNFSVKIPNTDPVKYQLMAEEKREARNTKAKTRQLTLVGDPSIGSENEKTVMLVGTTGSGKSTLVDGFINYILGVSFEDPFRFTLVNLESDEKKTDNQAQSQTEWITVYKISPQEGSRLDYTLNIIDTPGFGDTRGIKRDKTIIDQIRHLFSADGEQGVTYIDAVCFIVKAPDARLTATQTYIFHSIMSLFGKDIESNICSLITFADGAEPPVLSCLQAANLPFGAWFPFNNSALFASNKSQQTKSLSPMFWEMGCKSFQNFFETLKSLKTKSLMQTKDVLQQREHLQFVLSSIQPQVQAGLLKLNELQSTLSLFKKHKNEIEDNKDFTYESEVTKQVRQELPIGQYATNCLQCNISCHDNCAFADDEQKSRCSVMGSDGNCKVCTGKCHWSQHKNAKYVFKYVTEKKMETYKEKKKLYEKAKGEMMSNEKYLEEIEADKDCLFENINNMMEEMAMCKNRLKEIALRPDPLSTVEHIDQMIQAEEINKQVGYDKRIKMLNELKQVAQIDKKVEHFEQTVQKAKEDVSMTSGRKSVKKGYLRSEIDRMKAMFNI